MRLFFAVLLSEDVITTVTNIQNGLKSRITDSGVKWSRPEQFHFTLKFLGETHPERIEKLLLVGAAVKEGIEPFELSLGGLGGFPSSSRPSTLWLGAEKGAESLSKLALQLDALLVKYGYNKERRALTPHLTLARVKTYTGEAEAARILRSGTIDNAGTTVIDRFALMRSTLNPTGSRYTVVEEFPFS